MAGKPQFRICYLVIALCLAACKYAPAQTGTASLPSGTISIPYDPKSLYGFPVVQVLLNGRVRGAFVVDTGSSNCMMSDRLAAELGLTPQPFIGADGKPGSFPDGTPKRIVTVSHLEFPSARNDWPVPLIDGPFIVLGSDRLPHTNDFSVDGIIGGNLLKLFAVLFDFADHKAVLHYPGNLSPEALPGLGMEGASVIEKVQQIAVDEDCPSATTRINDQSDEQFLVDSGAGQTCLSARLARSLKLKPLGRTFSSRYFLGTARYVQARVASISLGAATVRDLLVRYNVDDKAKLQPLLLGMDFLSRFQVLIDYPARKMYLKPIADKPASSSAAKTTPAPDAAPPTESH